MDEQQFDECYRATVRRLVQFAYAMCGDIGIAQDLAHEAYLRAWQRRRQLTGYEDVEAWLRLVVTRLCTDRWRRLAVHQKALRFLRPSDPGPPPSDDTVMLVAALRDVPVKQRQAIVLHYLGGLAVDEIANEMGASAATRQILARPGPSGSQRTSHRAGP